MSREGKKGDRGRKKEIASQEKERDGKRGKVRKKTKRRKKER